jgi:ATP-dependent Clp protease adaptor protein ClpS
MLDSHVSHPCGLLDPLRAAHASTQRPRTPAAPGAPRGSEQREGGTATREAERVKRPDRWNVVLYNDDYTPMEFVVAVLQQVFEKAPTEATQIMLRIHRGGKGVAGVYILEVAETKVTTVHRLAEDRGYPLRAGVERE